MTCCWVGAITVYMSGAGLEAEQIGVMCYIQMIILTLTHR